MQSLSALPLSPPCSVSVKIVSCPGPGLCCPGDAAPEGADRPRDARLKRWSPTGLVQCGRLGKFSQEFLGSRVGRVDDGTGHAAGKQDLVDVADVPVVLLV